MTDPPGDDTAAAAGPLVELAAQLTDLVRLMCDDADGGLTIGRVLQYAAAAVSGCEEATVMLTRGGQHPETLAATGELAGVADQLELDTGEGPCLEALTHSDVALVNDLAKYSPWPMFGPRAVKATGFRSIVSFRLYLTDDHRGALNLYSTGPARSLMMRWLPGRSSPRTPRWRCRTSFRENKRMNLTRALERIGRSVWRSASWQPGELWTPEQAFDGLRPAGQELHRNVRDIAAESCVPADCRPRRAPSGDGGRHGATTAGEQLEPGDSMIFYADSGTGAATTPRRSSASYA